ncbi:MAG: helix-turn-helix transcriptional regulator [Chloroflexi bacterium]|nr:helix-turn-helix transcriptional regulator [Chloroflexota bacterium]
MNYKDYFQKLEGDLEYQKTERELKVILDLADDVLRLRMKKGWSQAELAQQAGTKQANISRLESGLSNPSINFLQKIAKALDTNISLKFEGYSPVVDTSTDTKDEIQAVPLPYKGFGEKLQVTIQSSRETSSASTRRI